MLALLFNLKIGAAQTETPWLFYHSTFSAAGFEPMQVWVKNDDSGCTVSFMVEDNPDPSSYGTCEVDLGSSIVLYMGSGTDYTLEFVESFELPTGESPEAVSRYY